MKYQLLHKKVSSKTFEKINSFSTDDKIIDFCTGNKLFDFLFISETSLHFKCIETELQTLSEIYNPMSICRDIDVAYLSHNEGIKSISINENFHLSETLDKNSAHRILGPLVKIGVRGISLACLNGQLAILIASLNKFFIYSNGTISKEIGCGKSGYSIASNIKDSYLNEPQGIDFINEDRMLVADTENHCIREFSENHKLICGDPSHKSLSPKKICYDRTKEIVYFLSNNYLKMVSCDSKFVKDAYEGEVISFSLFENGDVFILERL